MHTEAARGALGAVLAGGRSTRYGAPKAFATVGGERIIDRAIAAVRAVTPDIVLIANDAAVAEQVALPWRSDALQGLGALGGVHAALRWAAEERRSGVLAVACDMPFLSIPLLRHLVERGTRDNAADIVAPESGGRRGIEPLCAFYSTACVRAIEDAAATGDHRMIGFHDQVRVERVPLEVVGRYGDPRELFLNVNTTDERDAAEQIAHERTRAGAERA